MSSKATNGKPDLNKDGTKPHIGRTKGTPNKITAQARAVISQGIDWYFRDISNLDNATSTADMVKQILDNAQDPSAIPASFSFDILQVPPRDRLVIMEKLMEYAIPKLKATTIDINASVQSRSIADRVARIAAGEDVRPEAEDEE